jgi:general secretion pathway protein L
MSSATQSLQPLLENIRRAWRTSPMPRFFQWWGGELAALLPARWRQAFSGGALWYLLERQGDGWQLRRAGQDLVLARWSDALDPAAQQVALRDALRGVDPEDLRIALCLPAAIMLRRGLTLPLAARDSLQQIGAFEMDRQTPFRADQVRYDVRATGTPTQAGRFAAELVAVPRHVLDPQLDRLRVLGIGVDAVDMALGSDRLGVNLLPPEQALRRRHPRQNLNLALGVACILLMVLCLAEWLHNRQVALQAMQAQVESMRGEAQKVSALRQQLQDNAGAAGFLADRKLHTPSALNLLDDLSQRLPDDAWLERVNIDNSGQVGFQGQAKQAAKLVDALKGSPVITDANFQGTIQADPTSGKERFYMVAQLRKPADAKAKSAPAQAGSTR